MSARKQLACALVCVFLVLPAWAETEPPSEALPALGSEDRSDFPKWMVPQITAIHYGLSQFVDSTSRNIDRFFGTDDSLFVENQSFLRVRQSISATSGAVNDDVDNDLSVRFRLDLPTFKKRVSLLIESESEDVLDNAAGARADQFLDQRLNSNSQSLGLEQRGTGNGVDRWKNSLGVGARIRSQIDPYVRLTSTRRFLFSQSAWELNSFNRLTYFDRRGYVARTAFDAAYPFNENQALRFVTQAEWQEQRSDTAFSQSVEFNQRLNARTGMRYSLIALGDTARSESIYDYVLQAYYRRDLHNSFIFADVVPELHFPQEAGLEPYVALILRLEILFRSNVTY